MAFDDYTVGRYKGARVAVDKFIAEGPERLASYGLMRRLYKACKVA